MRLYTSGARTRERGGGKCIDRNCAAACCSSIPLGRPGTFQGHRGCCNSVRGDGERKEERSPFPRLIGRRVDDDDSPSAALASAIDSHPVVFVFLFLGRMTRGFFVFFFIAARVLRANWSYTRGVVCVGVCGNAWCFTSSAGVVVGGVLVRRFKL